MMIGPIVIGVSVIGVVVYLLLTDTLGHIRRVANEPLKAEQRLLDLGSVHAVLRLQFCSFLLVMVVPLSSLASGFGVAWYWLIGPALVAGFVAGRSWELLKRMMP